MLQKNGKWKKSVFSKFMKLSIVIFLLGSGICVGLLLWQSNVEIVKATEMNENKAYEIEMLEMMELVSENEYLELYFDEEETDIAVRDKESGYVWFSNPTDISEDTVSTGYYQKVLKSQINLTYINENTQISTMNNYTDSIMDSQFEVERLQDGICITCRKQQKCSIWMEAFAM